MTSSFTGHKNKSNRAPQPMPEHKISPRKPHTVMDSNITLLCCGLMTKLIFRKTSLWHYFSSNPLNAVLEINRVEKNKVLRSSVTIFQKVTSSRSKSLLVSRPSKPVSGTYYNTQCLIRTNPKRYEESLTAKLSFMAIPPERCTFNRA